MVLPRGVTERGVALLRAEISRKSLGVSKAPSFSRSDSAACSNEAFEGTPISADKQLHLHAGTLGEGAWERGSL